jgi:hypothetical protein
MKLLKHLKSKLPIIIAAVLVLIIVGMPILSYYSGFSSYFSVGSTTSSFYYVGDAAPQMDFTVGNVSYTITSPTIIILDAVSIGATTASIPGAVTFTGGEDPTVTIYWGTTDGGTTPASWTYNSSPTSPSQPQGVTSFHYNVTSLSSGTTYYFSASATNSVGTSWPIASKSFLTKPAAPTGVSATDGTYNNMVTVSWTKSTGATGYKLYRDSVLYHTVGDVASDDDSGANAPTITAGTASATDGSYTTFVVLTVTGASANNGTTHSYTIVAFNATGDSAVSTANTGYEGVGVLTYMWQRSAGITNDTFSDIGVTATTNPYSDVGAPADGSVRYFRCVLSATGAVSQTSTSDSGYRAVGTTTPVIITTSTVVNITTTTATSGGDITDIGSSAVTERGVCYGTSANPTTSNSKVSETSVGFPTGVYISNMSGLVEGTIYHVRAYAINTQGTSYGADQIFTTLTTVISGSTWKWYFPITITDTSGIDRTNISVDTGVQGTILHETGYMDADGMDTNMQLGDLSVPYMMGTKNTFVDVTSLPANSQITYNLYTGYTTDGTNSRANLPISVGEGGYITTKDAAGLELANDFEVELDGYILTGSTGVTNLVDKDKAYKEWVLDNNVLAVGFGTLDTNAKSVHSDNGMTWTHYKQYQSFTPLSNLTTDYIYVPLSKSGTPDDDLFVKIYLADGSHQPSGGALVTSTIAESGVPATVAWTKITFTSSYTFVAATEYVVEMSVTDTPSGSSTYTWYYVNGSYGFAQEHYIDYLAVDTWTSWTGKNFGLIIGDSTSTVVCGFGDVQVTTDITSAEHTVQVVSKPAIELDDASSQYIEVPDDALLEPGSGDYTRSFWVNFSSLPLQQDLFEHRTGWNNGEEIFWSNTGVLYWSIWDSSVQVMLRQCTFSPVVGTWYNLVFVRSGNNFDIYIDGVLIGTTTTASITIPDFTGVNTYGYLVPPMGGGWYYNGLFQDIRYLNRAISIAEIAEYQSFNYSDNSNLQLYLKCNDGTGVTVTDTSGNALNGTASGGCTWISDLTLYIDSVLIEEVLAPYVSVVGNSNDWLLYPNPYWNYYKHTVSGTEVLEYQPTYMPGTATYSTGTATFTQTSTAVLGSGTAWDQTMVGCVILDTGDTTYYIIESVTDTTHLTLNTAFTAATDPGTAYTILPGLDDLDNNYNGIITLGTNSNITVTYGAIVSFIPTSGGTGGTGDIGWNAPTIYSTGFLSQWFESGSHITELPLYGMYADTSTGTGIPVGTLYILTNLFFMIFFATLVIVKTRTIFMGLVAAFMVILVGIFQTVYPAWILLPAIVVTVGVLFVWRQQ